MDNCDIGPDGFCYTCQMFKEEHDAHLEDIRRDYENERETSCIGGDCCNPHVDHGRDECFTAEDCDDWEGSP